MKWFGAVLALALVGCASSGTMVSDEQVSRFQAGVTTRAEVVQTLGTPTSTTRMPDGTVMLIYSHAQVKTRPETFIPLVGAFIGGSDAYTNVVMLRFGADGKLLETTASEGAHAAGLGIGSGTPRPK